MVSSVSKIPIVSYCLISKLLTNLYVCSGTFMMFAVASFLAYIWVTYTVPETANVSLEEIDGMFRSSAGREEIVMKRQVCHPRHYTYF